MLPLLAILAIFKAMLDSPSAAQKDKAQVAKAGNYLAERLATVAALVDKLTPAMVALFDTIPHSKEGRQRELGKTLLFEVACGLAQRVPLTKLVKLDGDVRPYLTPLMVATLAWVGENLVVPEGMWIMKMIREVLNNMLLREASHTYDNYGLISR